MFVSPQPSPSLDVSMPGAATSSFSAAGHANKRRHLSATSGAKQWLIVAPILSSQPPEEDWSGKTRRHPPAWPCPLLRRRPNGDRLAVPFRFPPVLVTSARRAQMYNPVLPTAPMLCPTSSGHFFWWHSRQKSQRAWPPGVTTHFVPLYSWVRAEGMTITTQVHKSTRSIETTNLTNWHHILGRRTSLHSTTLHYITLHYITLHYITLHYITWHTYIHALHYITLHYITLHYITWHTYIHTYIHTCIALHCITLRYIPLPYITLQERMIHYIHYITLHYTNVITLHTITYMQQTNIHTYINTYIHYI